VQFFRNWRGWSKHGFTKILLCGPVGEPEKDSRKRQTELIAKQLELLWLVLPGVSRRLSGARA